MNWFASIQAGVGFLVLALLPRILESLGVFKWMAGNPVLNWLSRFLGSKDPGLFYNYVLVALILFSFFSAWQGGVYQTNVECQEVGHYVNETRACLIAGNAPRILCEKQADGFSISTPIPGFVVKSND